MRFWELPEPREGRWLGCLEPTVKMRLWVTVAVDGVREMPGLLILGVPGELTPSPVGTGLSRFMLVMMVDGVLESV
jgi:hypothetical protein